MSAVPEDREAEPGPSVGGVEVPERRTVAIDGDRVSYLAVPTPFVDVVRGFLG